MAATEWESPKNHIGTQSGFGWNAQLSRLAQIHHDVVQATGVVQEQLELIAQQGTADVRCYEHLVQAIRMLRASAQAVRHLQVPPSFNQVYQEWLSVAIRLDELATRIVVFQDDLRSSRAQGFTIDLTPFTTDLPALRETMRALSQAFARAGEVTRECDRVLGG